MDVTEKEQAILWLSSFVKNKEPMILVPKTLIRLMYDVLTQKPKTNYNRIISKTPEELATLISDNIDCGVCENVFGLRPCSERCCLDFWLDWLKQEATE